MSYLGVPEKLLLNTRRYLHAYLQISAGSYIKYVYAFVLGVDRAKSW
jgi:hypothetical protein